MDSDRVAVGFAQALLGGDPTAATTYFAPDSCLLTSDGTEVTGRHGIGAVLSQLTVSSQSLEIRLGRTIEVGEVALASQFWRLTSDGESFERSFRASFVLRRAEDRWAILIASPWG